MSMPNSAVLSRALPASRNGVLRDYLTLMKPGVMLLVLVTTAASMWVALGEAPHPWTLLVTLAGTMLAGGAAATLNHVLDRDMDAAMPRTSRRPIAAGRVHPGRATAFAVVLAMLSFALLYTQVNPLTAYIAAGGIAFYVGVYTAWLKRRTPQNIVIGGAAGAVGPLIGWAAATGRLDVAAVVMFLIVFFWTPPHFWALAIALRDEYAQAKVPMLPVVAGVDATLRQIYFYTWVTVAVTLAMAPLGVLSWVYTAAAVVLGVRYLRLTRGLMAETSDARARALYGYSIVYLFSLFAAMVLDVTVQQLAGHLLGRV
ncbi:protoheme IX farnesyltransferase [Thermaerobacter marianensis DSM 12885]|uniref:Protoheme IX farnesyltransferase n=1 Tax=Thermaerobacter marianensis (strain ATCC 700841 / DSM 12885 / JCM 10246 / 7p75a) TaxID=644966 RepID=E6SGA7_THEM7|nr:heme o synthase [Thermaerobacter marianensis]ADU50524.1 protoheme IX farnesyltransferase [Thermaerobacter marianensis DSM 12885]